MTFRSVLFWLHLIAGLISGLSIGIMCFTGTVLAFEKDLVAWSERDARRIEPPPPGTSLLTVDQMQAKLREAQPAARPMAILLQNDPRAAVAFTTGRTGGFYVNPYTGEVRQPRSGAMGDFMRLMTDWHRTLGFLGEQGRPVGKLINGVCNLAFCVLALTGLYLWLPRTWSWRALRPIVWFRQNESGKARDFNWHNVIGFWSAPVLIVLTLTAVPISFRWGGNLIYTLTGSEPPAAAPGGPGGEGRGPTAGGPAVAVPPPPAGAVALGHDALFAVVKNQVPEWETITLRLANGGPGTRGAPPGRGGPDGRKGGEGRPAVAPQSEGAKTPPRSPDSARPLADIAAATLPAASFTVRASASWPRTATTTLTLDPYTGNVLRRSGYADLPAAQQVRSWTRFLHTGEALGRGGQFFAGLACLGGCFLIYTGFALSWRRFVRPRRTPAQS